MTRINQEDASNIGVVVDLRNGREVFALKGFDYHSQQANYPVTFFRYGQNTHLIYASTWNSLDIIDLETRQCLTRRNDTEITDTQRENTEFTEWAGELCLSPDGKHLATIGWAWHPVGIAWCFNVEAWLQDRWESDFGTSKVILGSCWDYFWQSSFVWLDNEKIMIWGDPETQNEESDIPADSVLIYNVLTGEAVGGG